MARTVQQRFVSEMGTALREAGLPALPARVFSALLVDDDGQMTSAELVAALEISAGGVSGAVNYLATTQMIHRERVPGSRRDVYVVDEDAWHAAMMRSTEVYAPMVRALEAAIDAVGADAPQRRRLVLAREFLRFVDGELGAMAGRWERRKRTLLRELR